jgi:hypothetical protein
MSSISPRVRIFALFIAVSLFSGCGLLAQKSDEVEELEDESLPATSSSSHEVLSSIGYTHPSHPLSVVYPPPAPLAEKPSEEKPAGDDVVWIPGYWRWDTHRDDWAWVEGVWVHAPPRSHWVVGFWSIVADGWRWVPGYWAKDDPPALTYTPAPPQTALPYDNYVYNDPYYNYYGGYGMWFPWFYGGRSYRESGLWERPPLLPSGHAASIPVAEHGSGSGGIAPMPLPELASQVHARPTSEHEMMASALAAVPKPMTAEFFQHPELHVPGMVEASSLSHEHGGHLASLFSASHLASVMHEHPGVHEAIMSHPGGASGGGHGGGSHSSGGHGGGGGGHGR